MKEFEKWSVAEDGFKILKMDLTSVALSFAAQAGWEAALEWVLQIKKNGDKLAYYNDDILMAIEGEIKKEMKGEEE